MDYLEGIVVLRGVDILPPKHSETVIIHLDDAMLCLGVYCH